MLTISKNIKYIIAGVIAVLIMYTVNVYMEKSEINALKEMTVAEKKARFIKLVVPAVNEVYDELTQQYLEVREEVANNPTSENLAQLRETYRADTNKELLMALKPHPRSIAIAQAAMESSWATSKFTRKANNLFGVWSYDEDEDRMAAGQQRGDKTIWIKKYDSFKHSVAHYYKTLARHAAYKKFREAKMKSNDPYFLVTKLDNYSEKRHLYGEELIEVMKFNKFTKFDK